MGRPQLVDPLEDLGEAGDDEGELELGDLDDAVFVLLDIAARVVGLWACPAWQLVLEPGVWRVKQLAGASLLWDICPFLAALINKTDRAGLDATGCSFLSAEVLSC